MRNIVIRWLIRVINYPKYRHRLKSFPKGRRSMNGLCVEIRPGVKSIRVLLIGEYGNRSLFMRRFVLSCGRGFHLYGHNKTMTLFEYNVNGFDGDAVTTRFLSSIEHRDRCDVRLFVGLCCGRHPFWSLRRCCLPMFHKDHHQTYVDSDQGDDRHSRWDRW